MATVQNTIKLRDQMSPNLTKITNHLQKLVNLMNKVDDESNSSLGAAKRAAKKLKHEVDLLNRSLKNTGDTAPGINKVSSGMNGLRGTIVAANQTAELFMSTLRGIQKVSDFSDQQTAIQSRLKLMTGSLENAKALQEGIMGVANRSRGDYTSTANMVSQLGILASEAFSDADGNLNQNELLAFAEAVNKQFVISGTAGTVGADAAMLQLTQAMSSGVLRGDELRSIMEQAPIIADTVAKYMGVTKGELREIAGEGQVTSDIVKAALIGSLDEVAEMYKSMPVTAGQALTMLKNDALVAFQPLIERFSNFINSDTFQTWLSIAGRSFEQIAVYVEGLLDIIGQLGNSQGLNAFMSDLNNIVGLFGAIFSIAVTVATGIIDNWQWIGPIFWGVVAAVTALKIAHTIAAIATGIHAASEAGATGVKALLIGATMGLTGATYAQATAQHAANAAMLASPITWIILAIIALIAIIFLVVGAINKATGSSISAIGIIVGSLAVAAAFIWNLIVGLIDGILQFIWSVFILPFIGIIEWVLNVFNGGFNSFGDAVKNLLGNIIDWFLSLGKVVTKIIDAIFGTDWTAGLNNLSDKVLSWGKNENAITLDRSAPTIESMSGGKVGRWDYKDAWDKGYNWGAEAQTNIEDTFSGFDLDKLTNDAEYFAKKQEELNNTVVDGSGGGVHIQGEVNITDEDIKMMKDIAAVEWVNKFTTLRPEMTVTFGDVHETADTEKILETIETMVEEAYASALVGG